MSADTISNADTPAETSSIRSALPSLIIDGLLPFLTYTLLTAYVPRLSQVAALGLSATFPTINGLVTVVRRRHLDIIAAIVLVGITVSTVLAVSPFVFNGITLGLIAWTVSYGQRRRKRGAEVHTLCVTSVPAPIKNTTGTSSDQS